MVCRYGLLEYRNKGQAATVKVLEMKENFWVETLTSCHSTSGVVGYLLA